MTDKEDSPLLTLMRTETMDMTMRELFESMGKIGAATTSISLSNDGDKSVAAIMIVIGEDAQPCLDAFNKITDED